jgi:anti-anti-sigma factor
MDDDALVMQVRRWPGYTVITVAGEIDIATAPQLGERLAVLAGSGRPVIADLDQVRFIDAAGLRVLAAAARHAAAGDVAGCRGRAADRSHDPTPSEVMAHYLC